MGRLSEKGSGDPEAPVDGHERVPLNLTTANTSKAPLPMTQIMEALYFASGGDYDSGDDSWDPFEGYIDEERDLGVIVAEMEDDDEVEEFPGMGQALPATSSPWRPPPVIEKEDKVESARRNYAKNKDMFIHTLFKRVRDGNLNDFKVMTEALHKEGIDIDDLIDDKTRYPLMHKALLEDKQDIVEFLLKHKRGREMAMKAVKTEYCEELTPLYIAIQQGKAENVELLLDVLTLEDVNKKVKNTAYEKTFFNELPLAAALWSSAGSNDLTDLSAMFDCLVQKGAELDMKTDDGGNTLLHLLVAQSCQSIKHLDYFRKFLKQTLTEAAGIWYNHKSSKSLSEKDAQVQGIKKLFAIENNEAFTPLTLAAQLESPLYADLMNWTDVMRYSDAKRSQQFSNFDAYDVTNVTSLKRSPGKSLQYNRNSVMHVLAHNNVDITQAVWGKDIFTIEPLKSIISQKWQLYQFIFYFWGFLHLIYMGVLTDLVFRFGPKNAQPIQMDVDEIRTNMTMIANSNNASSAKVEKLLESGYYGPVKGGNPWFILFASLPLAYIIFEIIDHGSVGINKAKYKFSFTSLVYRSKGWISSLFYLTGNGVYRLIGLIFSIFTLIWIILHIMRSANQDIILSIALGLVILHHLHEDHQFPEPVQPDWVILHYGPKNALS